MEQNRSTTMEKARAKRRRHDQAKPANRASRKKRTLSTESFTEKVMDLAQGAAAQVGALVKTAAAKVTHGDDNKGGRGVRHRSKRP